MTDLPSSVFLAIVTLRSFLHAAKVVINTLLEMMKRPISHFDPALYTAHVMMWHRCQLNLEEKQTSILLRDMVDCGTYGYLGLDPVIIEDAIWKKTAVSKINALKTNREIGYITLDMTQDPKEYKKSLRKFNAAIEQAFSKVRRQCTRHQLILAQLFSSLS